jgi:3,4-dihydroxy-2-butanone 4-phosphate synthase
MDEIKLHDVVALLADLPEQRLRRGDVGTIVEVFEQTPHHPSGFIVEFVNDSGEVYAQADITDAAQLVKLHFNFQREAA